MTDAVRAFLDSARVAHLATADGEGRPHVVPVCFAPLDETIYIVLDEKPKRVAGRALKRVRNILQNGQVALVVDHWDEDWSRLGWVMVRGPAEILDGGAEHARGLAALLARYPQYREMDLGGAPMIAVRIDRITSWGALES